jgi:hypothetical protein
VKQVGGRGMYSFLHVCPGGVIAPCAIQIVKWLVSIKGIRLPPNSIVVELKLEDFKPFAKYGALAGMEFQKYRTKKLGIWLVKLRVPAQRMIDFTQSRVSSRNSENIIRSWDFRRNGTTVSWFLTQILREGFFRIWKINERLFDK